VVEPRCAARHRAVRNPRVALKNPKHQKQPLSDERLKMDVVKRGVWWLKKYGLIEEKEGKLYIAQRFSKPIEELSLNTCSLGDAMILLLDEVYIVYAIRERRIEYWSIPAKYCREILRYENMVGSSYTVRDIAHILDVDESTAKRVQLLLNLIRRCRFHQTS